MGEKVVCVVGDMGVDDCVYVVCGNIGCVEGLGRVDVGWKGIEGERRVIGGYGNNVFEENDVGGNGIGGGFFVSREEIVEVVDEGEVEVF